MQKYLVGLMVMWCAVVSLAQEVKYELRMDRPQAHYYQVQMELTDFKEENLEVKMPIWAPGSYLAREFAKNVDLVKAKDEKGNALNVVKTSKNTWSIQRNKASKVFVNYEVYAFELTVRTSFMDLTHAFVSGTSVFMYVKDHKDLGGTLKIFPYEGFKEITTALPRAKESVAADGHQTFVFNDYDQLADCPIEIGNQVTFSFDAAGTTHNVGIYGLGNYDIALLKKDMTKIVEAATDVFGQNPNKVYTFIIHNVTDGQGGLEHVNSTTLSVNRWTYDGNAYKGFLSLVAHEYFHLWNVKRIRPIELGPFDYDNENYTSLLWVMEGFTSYYDELLLRRAGYYSKEEYKGKLHSTLNYVEGSTGARVQPVAHASFDAWIKAYRPNENSRNTTISYYSKGTLIAAMLDAMMIKKHKGKKCLDDFMQVIYAKYFEKEKRGFTEGEFKAELEKFLGQNLDEFYAKYINGTEIPDYESIFDPIGLDVKYTGTPKPSVGLRLKSSGGKTLVAGVRRGSSAENAGLSVNDEIIGLNAMRISKGGMEDFMKSVRTGDEFSVLIARDQQLYSIDVLVEDYEQPRFDVKLSNDSKTQKLQDYWLRTIE